MICGQMLVVFQNFGSMQSLEFWISWLLNSADFSRAVETYIFLPIQRAKFD